MARNIGSDGMTYQNVAPACFAVFSASGLSDQSHTMPSTDTNGSEAISAPSPGYRFAKVDATAISTPEIAAFKKR